MGHGAPGSALPLCPQDLADEEPLNSLDFCSRNMMDVFISACWTPVLFLGGTVACDTHITLLESDSGLSVHLLSDFMWLGA